MRSASFFFSGRRSGGEEAFPVLFDGGVDVRVLVQAELADDVDGEMLRGHLPVVDEVHQDLRPLLASGHHTQRVLAQGFVAGDLTFPTEQQGLGDAFVVKLGRGLQHAAFEAGAALDFKMATMGITASCLPSSAKVFAMAMRAVFVALASESSLSAFLSASAFPLRKREREIAAALFRHVVVEGLGERIRQFRHLRAFKRGGDARDEFAAQGFIVRESEQDRRRS
jgi:hypothetical protein